jgi:hypothetical protein
MTESNEERYIHMKGRMRFEYGDQWITVVIESHGQSQTLVRLYDDLS